MFKLFSCQAVCELVKRGLLYVVRACFWVSHTTHTAACAGALQWCWRKPHPSRPLAPATCRLLRSHRTTCRPQPGPPIELIDFWLGKLVFLNCPQNTKETKARKLAASESVLCGIFTAEQRVSSMHTPVRGMASSCGREHRESEKKKETLAGIDDVRTCARRASPTFLIDEI